MCSLILSFYVFFFPLVVSLFSDARFEHNRGLATEEHLSLCPLTLEKSFGP